MRGGNATLLGRSEGGEEGNKFNLSASAIVALKS
jgi:hypothetical protein